MRRPANILLLAILIGALSATMVYRYFRAQQAELAAARSAGRAPTVDVIVASDIVPIGTRLEAKHLKAVSWPADAQPDGAIHDAAQATGRIALVTIQKNQPVVQSQLTSESAGLLPLLITEGMRGMSVKVDQVTGVSGFITPNSHVDVLVAGTVEGSGGGAGQRSKLILQNIKVLAIGPTIEMKDDKPVEVPTVTLLVSPADAEKLTLAARQEPVRLALRNYRDEEEVATSGVSTPQLFGVGAPHDGSPRVARPGPPTRPSVEILLGETRTRQPY
jgi:pilus assembly protein CpaB